jgi:hypothetical protein
MAQNPRVLPSADMWSLLRIGRKPTKGYVFITNLIPLHVFVLLCMGRYSTRVYISYTTWYALGLTKCRHVVTVANRQETDEGDLHAS